jgi:hypothetical protein
MENHGFTNEKSFGFKVDFLLHIQNNKVIINSHIYERIEVRTLIITSNLTIFVIFCVKVELVD